MSKNRRGTRRDAGIGKRVTVWAALATLFCVAGWTPVVAAPATLPRPTITPNGGTFYDPFDVTVTQPELPVLPDTPGWRIGVKYPDEAIEEVAALSNDGVNLMALRTRTNALTNSKFATVNLSPENGLPFPFYLWSLTYSGVGSYAPGFSAGVTDVVNWDGNGFDFFGGQVGNRVFLWLESSSPSHGPKLQPRLYSCAAGIATDAYGPQHQLVADYAKIEYATLAEKALKLEVENDRVRLLLDGVPLVTPSTDLDGWVVYTSSNNGADGRVTAQLSATRFWLSHLGGYAVGPREIICSHSPALTTRYTTDGSSVTESSPRVSKPITISGPSTLRARTFSLPGYQSEEAVATWVAPELLYSTSTFKEASNQEGAIENTITITLVGDTFTGSDGDDFVTNGKVTVSNVPAGLTAVATRNSATQITLALTGAAAQHIDDVSNLTVTFLNAALSNGKVNYFANYSRTDLVIDFDPNRRPIANSDVFLHAQDSTLSIDAPGVLGNDSDYENSPLTAHLVSGPRHGAVKLQPSGAFTYIPEAGFYGVDAFQYQASDGASSSEPGMVKLYVLGSALQANGRAEPFLVQVGDSVQLSCAPTGGTGNYVSYAWTGPGEFSSALANPEPIVMSQTGMHVYAITVHDVAGISSTEFVHVLVGETLSNLDVQAGKVRYRVWSASDEAASKDQFKISVQGLKLQEGDRVAVDFDGAAIGNWMEGDGLTLGSNLRAKGPLGAAPNIFSRCSARYQAKRLRLLFEAKRGVMNHAETHFIQSASGPSSPVRVAVLVDRAPADGVLDYAGIATLTFSVKVRTKADGSWIESGRGR